MKRIIAVFAVTILITTNINAYNFITNTCGVITLWPEHEGISLDDSGLLDVREGQQGSKTVIMLGVLEKVFPKYFKGSDKEKIEFIIKVQNAISDKNDALQEKAYGDPNNIYTEQVYDKKTNEYLRNLKVLSFFLNKKLLNLGFEKQYYGENQWNLCTNNELNS